jgi:hypothetical protein
MSGMQEDNKGGNIQLSIRCDERMRAEAAVTDCALIG